MAQVKELLRIVMHTDSETGLHRVGELDFRVPTSTHGWFDADDTGGRRREMASWLHRIAHGIEHENWFSLAPPSSRTPEAADA